MVTYFIELTVAAIESKYWKLVWTRTVVPSLLNGPLYDYRKVIIYLSFFCIRYNLLLTCRIFKRFIRNFPQTESFLRFVWIFPRFVFTKNHCMFCTKCKKKQLEVNVLKEVISVVEEQKRKRLEKREWFSVFIVVFSNVFVVRLIFCI